MGGTSLKHIQHLYWRAGFGISPDEAKKLTGLYIDTIVDKMFDGAEPQYLHVVDKDTIPKGGKGLQKAEKKMIQKERRRYGELLNTTWLEQLAAAKNPLLEKTTLFWHGHFACRIENIYAIQELNNIERKYAFGHFKDLLLAVSKSPAMLQFLNNQQNRKMHPNENFARELMELFTIGHGYYTEKDIKESARAFTGWGFDRETSEFQFRPKQNDEGEKTFFGKTGNFAGEDIIDLILANRYTAYFLCRKFYKFYVNDEPDENIIEELADTYRATDYDTGNLLKMIFKSKWFYDERNMGTKIKSPVEFITGLSRTFNISYHDKKTLIQMQRGLGQILFYPPNVAGWAGGRNYIDSSTLLLRLKIPSLILNGGVIDFDFQSDDPDAFKMMEMEERQQEKVKEKANTTVDWNAVLTMFPKDASKEEIINCMLQPTLNKAQKDNLFEANEESLKKLMIQLVSMPEYQMC